MYTGFAAVLLQVSSTVREKVIPARNEAVRSGRHRPGGKLAVTASKNAMAE